MKRFNIILGYFLNNNISVNIVKAKTGGMMTTIAQAQEKLLELIHSRNSIKQTDTVRIPKLPSRIIGERMLDAFANQIQNDVEGLESDPYIEDELVESLLSTLALAGLVGIDLESKLEEILSLMEIVTADSS